MKSFGIRAKLSLIFCFFILALFIPFSIYLYHMEKDNSLEEQREVLYTQAEILRKTFASEQIDDPGLQEKLTHFAQNLPIRITVIDGKGTVRADSQYDPLTLENHLHFPEVQNALQGKKNSSVHESEFVYDRMLYVALPLDSNRPDKGIIQVSSSLSLVESIMKEQLHTFFLSVFIFLGLSLLFSLWLAKQVTLPIVEMTDVAKRMTAGDLALRIKINHKDEIGVLASSLNQLTGHLSTQIKKLTQEQIKLRSILQELESPVLLVDHQGTIAESNPSAEVLFKNTSLPSANNISDLNHPILNKLFEEARLSGSPLSTQVRFMDQTHPKIWQLFIAPLSLQESSIKFDQFLIVFQDVTDLQLLYEQQAEFVANASHELLTPLTSIQGYAETLLTNKKLTVDTQQEFIQTIYNETQRMSRLSRALLEQAKLDIFENPQKLKIESLHLPELIEKIIDTFEFSLQSKHLSLTQEIPADLPILNTNSDRFKQILSNLLSNAIKYTPDNGEISIKSWASENKIHLEIADTGIGIPEEDLPKIFQRFFRVDRSRSSEIEGTGLGLSIVQHLMHQLGGEITVSSNLNHGTTAHLIFPL